MALYFKGYQTKPLRKIKEWILGYKTNKQAPMETNSVTFGLKEMEDFIKHINDINLREISISKKINALRFYLVRQDDILDPNLGTRNIIYPHNPNGSKTQISLVAVPVVNYRWRPNVTFDLQNRPVAASNHYRLQGKDYKPSPSKIICLYPESNISEHTGLCPLNCDDTLDGN